MYKLAEWIDIKLKRYVYVCKLVCQIVFDIYLAQSDKYMIR